ncbi:hypothetical protein C0J52_04417 [Blattella germanica]|nr:hypothetical protein C0J52_04417 [Blattella germanica]PSN47312.1 hypothetical protein C0J52_04417 [Blattella germanica]
MGMLNEHDAPDGDDVVISGISGEFPSASNMDELRDMLFKKEDMMKSTWGYGMFNHMFFGTLDSVLLINGLMNEYRNLRFSLKQTRFNTFTISYVQPYLYAQPRGFQVLRSSYALPNKNLNNF